MGRDGAVQAGNPIEWTPSIQGAGAAQVTTANPRAGYGNVGTGSLELSVTGNRGAGGQYPDWAFYYRYAGADAQRTIAAGQSFGMLEELTSLSFDWFRTALPGWDAPTPPGQSQPLPPADWRFKTPVLRLQLLETVGNVSWQSELIWEGYYNQAQIGGVTPVNQWVTTANLQDGNFWYDRPPTVPGGIATSIDARCNAAEMSFWAGTTTGTALEALLGNGGCLSASSARVIGVAVGVGSQWPLPYHGFVDNVRIGFGDAPEPVLDANFDFVRSTVPEPASVALTGVGLLALGAAARRRRRVRSA